MHQRAFPHIDAQAHAMLRCPWHWVCVRLHLIVRLIDALLMSCTTNPIDVFAMGHLSHSTKLWHYTPGLVSFVHGALALMPCIGMSNLSWLHI